ncbi:WXG100 family type VII secretion target [Nocardia cyriacigeorgica]|jgi:uncharacterized protein YukE|uniref:WXG100 family type VII secretion target n=1 Tax=Nocardia cyriacigeorgica TaxID=135487 RepID=UPI0002E1DFCB|nr:hypothetical protein [Nocardia cyriacigeorgica]TLF55297.1 hypothetical protein FEK31_21115 [Nocardia cyriacigeorgica]
MGISYNYSGVETSSLSFQQIVSGIETNNGALRNLEAQLKGAFTGIAADTGWHPQIDRLMAKVEAYQQALNGLKTTIQQVAGDGGYMQVTDKDQGSRFLAINI